ncbi:MFS transporter [Sulfurimonas autotrophica]|uniref:Major facilitator superfamily MFS_1 n=1 Tax=Sulfurimonas autotrophica (strain ATCC BAA-671 / DSM 16294 / JCM 11897 / OK10) TaxID=563040 RepID=E0URB9_SULAO|nr:MFS transporter [Sulfurimonas autotrophica]ADN08929.1 major facilitator superfamily MFS_1 [Sulfurimonas autotrophica DSM 16294]
MKEYITLLKEEKVLRKLSAIQLISYFGAWFSNVAIYTLLIELHVSAWVIGFVAMLNFLAGVIQAPLSGPIIDRMNPKKLMLSLIVVEIIATISLIFVTQISDLWLLYLLIFFKMAAASFYFTTEMSLLPKILHGSKLQRSNELHSIIWSLSYTLGMAVSGFVVYWFGIKTAFLLDGFMFVIAFVLLYKTQIQIEMLHVEENIFAMMKETFVYVKKNPKALHLMLVHSFVGLTAFDALVALMVERYYASVIATSLALGLLHSARAVGLVIGPIYIGKWINNKRLMYIFIAQGLAVWLWAFVMHNFYLSLAASVIVGFFTTTLWSYSYTLLQKNIEKKYYGRIVAYNDMLFLSSAAFTSYMIGFLATHSFSLEAITAIMGSGFFIGAIYYKYVLKSQKIKEIS